MKNKKPRNKKYIPKLSYKLAPLALLAKHMADPNPMDEDAQRNAMLALNAAVQAFELGYAEAEHFNALIFNVNIARVLADMGIGEGYDHIIQPAMAAMWRCKNRSVARHEQGEDYTFEVDADGMVALKEFCGLHEEQIRISTLRELEIAKREMERRIAMGIGFTDTEAKQAEAA